MAILATILFEVFGILKPFFKKGLSRRRLAPLLPEVRISPKNSKFS
jgi:hypothetical protein